MSSAKSHVTQTKSAPTEDAITLLTTDHANVKKLFKDFDSLKEDDGTDTDKSALVTRICNELKVHAQIEEESFYPEAEGIAGPGHVVDELKVAASR